MSCKGLKIVYCIPALYSSGGVERVISVKSNFFAERYGYDVTIIVTEGKGKDPFFPLSERVKVINLGLDFEELWHQPFLRKVLLYLKKQRQYKKLLTAELMRLQPDITISVLRREINFITKVKDGSRKVGELHVDRANYRSFGTDNVNYLKRFFEKFWKRNLIGHLKKLQMLVVLTETSLNDWPELNHVMLIPDPLPFQIRNQSVLTYKRIISIGHYSYDKGYDLLLLAWAKVEKQMPDWELNIFGDGDREPYEQLMGKLGISRCYLHGSISDVRKEYIRSSIFVLPSRFEGFGLVLVEAMAHGVPVVSFDCENGPRSIISNGVDGFLIEAFDIDIFSDKILQLAKDDNLRMQMGTNAKKKALRYDVDLIGHQWKQLFDKLMKDR